MEGYDEELGDYDIEEEGEARQKVIGRHAACDAVFGVLHRAAQGEGHGFGGCGSGLLHEDSVLWFRVIVVRQEVCNGLNAVYSRNGVGVHQVPLVHDGKVPQVHPGGKAT